MDSDSFYPAFVTAARVLGLGEVIVKKITTSGIKLIEEKLKNEKPPYTNLNQVEWFSNALGRIASYITGLEFEVIPLSGKTIEHQLEMGAIGSWGTSSVNISSVDVEPEAPEAMPSVVAEVPARVSKAGIPKIIVDSEEKSSFIQVHSTSFSNRKNIRMLNGLIQKEGTVIFGTGFTVTRTGVGQYKIVFKEAFPAGYCIYGNDSQNTGRLFSASVISAVEILVSMRNPGTFATEDIAFSFMVLGSA